MKYIEISQLVVHPRNVRARSEYREESLASLAASIKALGLLQSLVAQQLEDGSYGVLAGRRRLMAMERLQAEGALAADFKAPCKVIGKDVDHVTALSLAENAMQEPMDPIDEYEAFAAMVQEGDTPEGVAAAFGTTVRAVKERLRLGLVHPAIRDAVRQRVITLDALKAYAGHPCPVTQKRVFDALAAAGTTQAAWTIRQTLEKEHLRADDPLARFVMEAYRARGGAIIAGLFEEDTVLEDRALAEACRDDLLMAQAEAIRAAHGFAWAEIRVSSDFAWKEKAGFAQIHPARRALDEAAQTRLSAIGEELDAVAEEMAGIEERFEAGGLTEDEAEALNDRFEALEARQESLEEEAEAIQTGYAPDQAARAGVIVVIDSFHRRVETYPGLVRPADYAAWQAELRAAENERKAAAAKAQAERDAATARISAQHADNEAASAIGMDIEGEDACDPDHDDYSGLEDGSGADAHDEDADRTPAIPQITAPRAPIGGNDEKAPVDPLSAEALSASLRDDLAVEQAMLAGAALAEDPDLARDALTYALAVRAFADGTLAYGAGGALALSIQQPGRMHSRKDVIDPEIDARMSAAMDALDLRFLDPAASNDARFAAFRALDDAMKGRILALCVGQLVEPTQRQDGFAAALTRAALPEPRALWRPTAANYWSRVSREQMLTLLESFGMAAEAEEHRTAKKAALAEFMEQLFARPFATLSPAQQGMIARWTPPSMIGAAASETDQIEDDGGTALPVAAE